MSIKPQSKAMASAKAKQADKELCRGICFHIADRAQEPGDDLLAGCPAEILRSLSQLARKTGRRFAVGRDARDCDKDLVEVEALLKDADEKLHVYPFNKVDHCYKQLYTDASILKAILLNVKGPESPDKRVYSPTNFQDELYDTKDAWLQEIVETVDMAFLMTGIPGSERERFAEEFLTTLQTKHEKFSLKNFELPVPTKFQDSKIPHPTIRHKVAYASGISMSTFEKHLHSPRDPSIGPEPLVINDESIKSWPAFARGTISGWKSPIHLLQETFSGRRLVPIETGKSYVSEGWGQKIITFKDYLFDYILEPVYTTNRDWGKPKPKREIGYLAQHALLKQIPALRKEVAIPDYCYVDPPGPLPPSETGQYSSLETPKLDEPLVNAWFGPEGTTSPLHYDPFHNLLVQVVGEKYVRLYSPLQTGNVYPRYFEEGIDMRNTSRVDIGRLMANDAEALKGFDRIKNAEYVECVLKPGDMLYIPVGWWHYVHSLEVSFSVSFWWN